jgi:tetratricopeptide (TPR) repeat protein
VYIINSEENKLTKEEIQEIINKKKRTIADLEKGAEYIKELSDIGLLQLQIEEYSLAEKNLTTCLKFFKKQKDRLGKTSVLGILGILYFKKGDYEKAIDYYEKAFAIYDELRQQNEKIMCLKGIGSSYLKLNKLNKAAEVLYNCCEVCSENNEIYSFLDCIGQLIQIYEKKEDSEILTELYQKALQAFEKINDKKGMITSYFNLGILNKRNQKYQNALVYFKKGTNVAIDSNYNELILKGLSYVGESLFYLGRIKEAKDEFIKALDLAKKMGAKNAISQISILLKSFGLSDQNIKEEIRKYQEEN